MSSAFQNARLKISIEKCTIGDISETYHGYRINKEGLHPMDEKIKAIKEAPVPTNVTQFRIFFRSFQFL